MLQAAIVQSKTANERVAIARNDWRELAKRMKRCTQCVCVREWGWEKRQRAGRICTTQENGRCATKLRGMLGFGPAIALPLQLSLHSSSATPPPLLSPLLSHRIPLSLYRRSFRIATTLATYTYTLTHLLSVVVWLGVFGSVFGGCSLKCV
jgi:hypothetical protein